jgi:3-hydroxybutyryl-CoA dehydratase
MSDSIYFEDLQVGQKASTGKTITALDPVKKRATLKTTCAVAGNLVIDGEALVIPPSRG